MTTLEITKTIIDNVSNFNSLTELEEYLNSKEAKELLVNFQIERIKEQSSGKLTKYNVEQIKEYKKAISNIDGIQFKLFNFKLKKEEDLWKRKLPFNMRLVNYEDLEKTNSTKFNLYKGQIEVRKNKDMYLSGTDLLKDTIFYTGSGGGSHELAEYEISLFEYDFPNLKNTFLLDKKKKKSISGELFDFSDGQFQSALFEINNKKEDSYNIFLKRFNEIVDQEDFTFADEIINVKNLFFKDVTKKYNKFYINYLKNVRKFYLDENNINNMISVFSKKGYILRVEETNRIKSEVLSVQKQIAMELFLYSHKREKINIYDNILNLHESSVIKNKNKINVRVEMTSALQNKEFFNYAFEGENPKFLNNINNIGLFLTNNLNLNSLEKINSENYLLKNLKTRNIDEINTITKNYLIYSSNDYRDKNFESKSVAIEINNFMKNSYLWTFQNKKLNINDVPFLIELSNDKNFKCLDQTHMFLMMDVLKQGINLIDSVNSLSNPSLISKKPILVKFIEKVKNDINNNLDKKESSITNIKKNKI